MSYILDALKRSERERRGQGPANDPLLEGGAPAPAPSRPLWPVLLGLALLANAGVLAGYLLLREPAPSRAVAPPPSTGPATESQPRPRQAPETPPGPSAEASAEPPESAPAAAPPEPPPPAEPTAAEPARQQASAESAPPAAEASPPPPDAAPSTPAAPWEALPYLEELPAGFRSSVPGVTVNVHVFTDDPARRFVLVDLRRYREGDELPGGLRLLHITPEGVALGWRGRRFRLSTR